MKFHYYHEVSGELHTSHVATNIEDETRALDFAKANAPADHIPIKGSFDRRMHRINVATGVAHPKEGAGAGNAPCRNLI